MKKRNKTRLKSSLTAIIYTGVCIFLKKKYDLSANIIWGLVIGGIWVVVVRFVFEKSRR